MESREKSITAKLVDLRARESCLSEKLKEGEKFGETYWQLEEVRGEIEAISSAIPSSGATGMVGGGPRSPEPERFSRRESVK